MDKSKIAQNSLRKEILNKNSKIRTLSYRLNNEVNEYELEELEEDLNNEKKLLSNLMKKLNEEIINDKKNKAVYKKSLYSLRESLINFAKTTRGNDDLRKGIVDINNIMLNMEKYLNS